MQERLRFDALKERAARLPRYPLAHLPTPLEPLPRLSKALGGPRIHIKRDDCTGLAFGGNKTRHNEFLIGEALEQGADLVVWGAGVQSNNCRQTAAACAKAGLECYLVLGRGDLPGDSAEPVEIQGNLLLDHLLGADYEIVEESVGAALDERITEAAERFRRKGRRVYAWDHDRLNPRAAVSYVLCLAEILEQSAEQRYEPDAVYVSSAGPTGSGLALGAAAFGRTFPVRSICPMQWEWDTQDDMTGIANRAAELLAIETRLKREDLEITFDYIGPGYGQVSCDGLEATALLARTEGILVDPIYSGKALAGLIDHIRQGRFREVENVVFLHTGGTPALFAYHREMSSGIAARRLD